MSEFRRRILTAALTADGGSWYRICEGGIYTTDNAYINTLQSGFRSGKTRFEIDHKVLVGDYSYQRILMGATDLRKYWLVSPTFNQINHPKGLDNCYGSGILDLSGSQSFLQYRPFIGKRINFVWPATNTGERNYIQFFENGQWGEKIHATSQYSDGNYTSTYNMYIFAYNNKGTVSNFATDVTIYSASGSSNSVVKYNMFACQLLRDIDASLASDNKAHQAGEYGMYDEVTGKFFGNANSTGYFIENID